VPPGACLREWKWHVLLEVRHRIQISIGLFLCFIATGAQWDLLQTFAWGRMVVNHSRAMPLAQAVRKTFDGELCSICRMVAKAEKQERANSDIPNTKFESKILFFFQAVPKVIVAAPCPVVWCPTEGTAVTAGRSSPPVPPPRAGLA